jgi:hypothetical protein
MLLKIAFVLLVAWLLGVLGLYRIGDLVHVLLLVGLMLLLLGALKARDAAAARGRDVGSEKHDHSVHLRQLPQVRAPKSDDTTAITAIPRALESYPSGADQTLAADLAMRVQVEPFNALATGVFVLAILHTFAAARFARLAHRVQHRHDEEAQAHGRPASPSLRAEALHFLGEVEVVFGLWAVVLLVATTAYAGWEAARHYVSETVNYTEPLFVVVIMALASTRPVIGFCRVDPATCGGCWWRDTCRMVGSHPDDRTGAGLVHHRAGSDDDLRPVTRTAVL